MLAIRRKVCATLVDATVQPLAKLECVRLSVPPDHRCVPRWATAKHDRCRRVPGEQDVEAGRHERPHLRLLTFDMSRSAKGLGLCSALRIERRATHRATTFGMDRMSGLK